MKGFFILLVLFHFLVQGDAVSGQENKDQKSEITGQISTPDGTPLVGARIDISTAAPKVGPGLFCPSCYLDCRKSATTDEDGKFHLTDLSHQLKFRLVVSAPGHQTIKSKLLDPAAGSADFVLQASPENVDASRVVSGIVRDPSGNPIVGALVDPYGAETATRRWQGKVEVDAAVSDFNGRFSMLLPESMLGLDVDITQHGFCGERILLMRPGAEPVEIEMREGARVEGRLVENGTPVAGMSIAVVQLDRGSSDDSIFVKAVGDVTDQDGRFEFRNLPPDQRYCIYSVVGEANRARAKTARVLTVKKFNVPASGEVRDLGELEVAKSVSIRGQIKNVDGKPLPKKLKLLLGRDPAWDLIAIPVSSDGLFEIAGLPPETYEINLRSRKLEIVAKEINRQLLSPTSIGIYLDETITDLVIPVQGR